jgi:hypothetical protein
MFRSELLSLLLRTLAVGYLSYYVYGTPAHIAWFAVFVLTMHTFWAWADYLYVRGRASARATPDRLFTAGDK